MIKIISLMGVLLTLTTPVLANLINFEPSQKIKASEFNANFNFIKSQFLDKNAVVNFSQYTPGQLIERRVIEEDFDQVRALGISVSVLNSDEILVEELNKSFQDIITGFNSFDDIPSAPNANFTVNEDTLLSNSVSFINAVGVSSVELVSPPTKGTLNLNSATGSFIYMPNLNVNGEDYFTFKVNDGRNSSNVATASISITPVNDAPLSVTQAISTSEDYPVSGTLSGSDIDQGDSISYIIVSQGAKGIVTVNSLSGAFTYAPSLNMNGTDTFTFKVNDGKIDSNISTVSISISPVNDTPVSNNQLIATNEDTVYSGTLSALDPDANPLTYSLVAQGGKGLVSITNSATGTFTYTPNLNINGSDSFTFKVNDGTVNSNTATVTVTINAVNDIPLANTQSIQAKEYSTTTGILSGSDIDGDPLSYVIASQGTKGVFAITNAQTGTFSYVPNVGAQGVDSFTFRSNDGLISSSPATVSVTVTPVDSSCENIKQRGLPSGYYNIDLDSFTSGLEPVSLYCEFDQEPNAVWTQVARVNQNAPLWNEWSSDSNLSKTSNTESFGVKMQRFTQKASGRDLEVMFKVDGQYRDLVYYDVNLDRAFNPTLSTGAIASIQQGIFYRNFGETSYTRCEASYISHNAGWNWSIADASGSGSCAGYNSAGGFILHGNAETIENGNALYGLNYATGLAFSNVEIFIRKRTLAYPISCQHGHDNGLVAMSGVTYNNIDIDSDGSPQTLACSGDGVKNWTMLINFGSASYYNNYSVLRNSLISNDYNSVVNAGFSTNANNWNNSDYPRNAAYLQFFYGGEGTGYIYIRGPKWGGEVLSAFYALNGSTTTSRFRISGNLGNIAHSTIKGNTSSSPVVPYIYKNADTFVWEEYPAGVAAIDTIWIK